MSPENQSKISFFDLPGAIATGLFNGFLSERIAHWMKPSQPEFLTPMLLAALSYLLVFLILKRKRLIKNVHAQVVLAVLGSVVCFLSLELIGFAKSFSSVIQRDSVITNLDGWLEGFIVGLFLHTLTYSFFALGIIGTPHLMVWLIKRCRTDQWT